MPRIDDLKIQNKIFKKKEYRSWDKNLLEKLKLTVDDASSQKIDITEKFGQNKPKSNRVQLEFNKGSNKVQLEFNKSSNRVQQGFNKGSNRVQLELNKGSNEVQENPIDRVQLGFISDRNQVQKLISKLSGNEKKIFFYAINLCSIKGTLSTGEIFGEELNKSASTTRNGRETAVKRLIKKGLLKRERGKTGANGLLNLYVSELIKSEALNYLNVYTSEQTLLSHWGSIRVQNDCINGVQLESSDAIYNSSNINNTTTKPDLPENWLRIHIEPLKKIGFSLTQLKQLYEKSFNTPEIIQESINHFAFGLENNPKIKQYSDPLNVLMGVLRKGQAWIEQNYESPQEIAQRQLLERKKAERERLKQLEEEAFQLALEEWKSSLSTEQLESIAPPKQGRGDLTPQEVKLSMYFKENIWPEKRGEYIVPHSF